MLTAMDAISREEIIEHNLHLHEQTAEQYDDANFYLRNKFEQAQLWSDLSALNRILEERVKLPIVYLDLGCGTGNLSLKLLSLGAQVIGVDLSPKMIQVVDRKAGAAGHGSRFAGLVGSADDLSSIADAENRLSVVNAVCISSVLHHLHDYLKPFQELRNLCPALEAVFITHEPCGRSSLASPGQAQRIYNRGLRKLDVLLSKTIKRPPENCPDDPVADYHAFKNGIDEAELQQVLSAQGFRRKVIHQRYNMRRTTLASRIDNGLLTGLRNDIFPITMFSLAMIRE